MLCLSLAPSERMYLGNDVTIINTTGQRIRVAIDAPKHIKVVRSNAGKRKREKPSEDAA